MDDNTDIAFLAASMERQMRDNLKGSSGMRYNRTDFRKFLNGNQPMPHHINPQQQYPQHQNFSQPVYPPQQVHPQQYAQPPQANNMPVDIVVPEGVLPPSNAQFHQFPQQYQQYIAGQMPPQGYAPPQHVESVDGFQVPNYSNPPNNGKYLEDEQEFRDALIKEVKAQKKAINKLNREVESLILLIKDLKIKLIANNASLPPEPEPEPTPETIDDNQDKS